MKQVQQTPGYRQPEPDRTVECLEPGHGPYRSKKIFFAFSNKVAWSGCPACEAAQSAKEAAEHNQRAAVEAEAHRKRQAEDVRQRELARVETERAAAVEMMQTFKARFGGSPQYARVLKAIDSTLALETA